MAPSVFDPVEFSATMRSYIGGSPDCLKHLKHSNEEPTEYERAQTSAFIAEGEALLAPLEDLIRQVKARLDALIKSNRALHSVVREYRGIIAPVRRVPVEILQKIFMLCSEVSTPDSHKEPNSLVVSRVCRGWRRAALSYPGLWTDVYICKFPSEDTRTKRLVDLSLSYSACHPLFVCITNVGNGNSVQQTLEKLIKTCPRWDTFIFNIFLSHLHPFSYLKGRLSTLKCLGVIAETDSYDDISLGPQSFFGVPDDLANFFTDAPRLSIIRGYPRFLLRLPLPRNQIKIYHHDVDKRVRFSCESQEYDVKFSLWLLLFFPNLESADVYVWRGIWDGAIHVHHSSLSSLSVLGGEVIQFLRNLTLPALTTLTVDDLSSKKVKGVMEFLKRSACHLSSLDIYFYRPTHHMSDFKQDIGSLVFLQLKPYRILGSGGIMD